MSNSYTQLDKPIKIEVAVDHVCFFFLVELQNQRQKCLCYDINFIIYSASKSVQRKVIYNK